MVPAAQFVQGDDDWESPSTWPAGQFVQPVESASCPAVQPVQAVAPAPVVDWPPAHWEQAVAALKARCTKHFVAEPVPADVKSVENVNTVPLAPETVRSELSGAASHVCPEMETSCKTAPLEMTVNVQSPPATAQPSPLLLSAHALPAPSAVPLQAASALLSVIVFADASIEASATW